jgi:hypothetical protein
MEAIIILLIPLFQQWIKQCQARRNSEDIVAGLRNPGILEYIGARSVVRRNRRKLNIRRRDIGEVADVCMERLVDATEDQVRMLMDGDTAGLVASLKEPTP